MKVIAMCAVLLVACAGRGSESTGADRAKLKAAVVGLARDSHTGEPVGMAEIELRGPSVRTTSTNKSGLYTIDGLAAGTYTLRGVFAGQPIEITNILVHDGEATYVDIMFTLGDPQPIRVVFGDRANEITRYYPKTIAPQTGVIEGIVADISTRERVAGAVVTAAYKDPAGQLRSDQTVSDDHGRYRFANVIPGTYTVSAYYSIGGRAQVEVQRNQIEIKAGEAVVVPLMIELAK